MEYVFPYQGIGIVKNRFMLGDNSDLVISFGRVKSLKK